MLRRLLGRTANRVLERLGLEIVPVSCDLDSLLLEGPRLDRMFAQTAEIAAAWLSSQTIHPQKAGFDVEQEVRLFVADYLASPFRNPRGGSRMGNLLWLNLIAKAFAPDIIVDSGTFAGASAWALARGNPGARILSFDPDLSRLRLRVPAVEYIQRDWTTTDAALFEGKDTLCYFDDHVDQWRRIEEAHARGVATVILDDDYAVHEFPPMAHGGSALPKASFLFDFSLGDGEVIRWREGNNVYDWTVRKTELDRVRSLVARYERLPNAAAAFGCDQMPYSLAALGQRGGGN